jgi:D-alanyl-D-alanine carboxypeptidase/D-alanyl-D-alanine-endopeptidase (penicillin-binding protein 4)
VAHVAVRDNGRFGTVAMFVMTLTAFAAIVVTLWLGGAFNGLICGGDCGAAAIRTPDELNLVPSDVAVEPSTESAPELNAAAIRSAVEDPLDNDDKLGPRVAFAAVDARTGEAVAAVGSGALVPASTAKVLTAFTVLSKVDPQQRFATSVVRTGNHLVLVGGGDPYLRSEPPEKKVFGVEADVETLAARTAAALRRAGIASVQLDYNASRFSGPSFNPAWEASYRAEKLVTPISALWVDRGIDDGVRTTDPAADAADAFADALEDVGVDVADDHQAVSVPSGATRIASVRSATVARITVEMVASSDNEAAEVMLRQAALAAGRPGSFDGGVDTVLEVLRANGVDTTGLALHDGSGLSRRDRIAPVTLAQAIAKAAASPRTASLIADLPVANFSGTMDRRFGDEDDGKGVVRAKTGTLTDIHSLTGVVTDRLGTPIVFAVMADQAKDIPKAEAEDALDAVVAALARCVCSARTVGP